MSINNALTPFPYLMGQLNNISPLTYRDGATYLKVLEKLICYVQETQTPEIQALLEKYFTDFQEGITNAEQTVTLIKSGWQELFDEFMADVVSQLEVLNDQAVANLVANEGSKLREQLEIIMLDNLYVPVDPFSFIDSVKLITSFRVRENNETSWIQGFSINNESNEVYVANQNGVELRIDIRDMVTGVRKDSKIVVTQNNSFTESLDWFYNFEGDLCFIVFPKAGGASPSAYAIYNYTQEIMSAQIPIYGFTRSSRNGKLFITSDAWTNTVTKIYVYDWESVKALSPILLDTVNVENTNVTAAKNQGIASTGDAIFYAQGSQTENPTISAFDFTGKLRAVKTYSRGDFMSAVNKLIPGTLTNPAYLYEVEGATSLDGKLVTGQIVNNNPAITSDAVFIIMQHNNLGGVRISAGTTALKVIGDWKDVVMEPGWLASSGGVLQARLRSGQVEFRGFLSNPSFAGNYTKAASLPEGIPAPKPYSVVGGAPANTIAKRSSRVTTAGGIEFYSDVANGAWYGLGDCGYGI